jgi:hypothetical protein
VGTSSEIKYSSLNVSGFRRQIHVLANPATGFAMGATLVSIVEQGRNVFHADFFHVDGSS